MVAALLVLSLASVHVQQQPPAPQVVAHEGRYVVSAHNDEGYAIVGYRLANESVGEEWMLLELGLTLREGQQEFTLTREGLSLITPDGATIRLPSIDAFRKANLQALDARGDIVRDSIRYFPRHAWAPCGISFFSDLGSRTAAGSQLPLTSSLACVGRIYFKVPGGIIRGDYSLEVQFESSRVRVPFSIASKEKRKG